MNGTMPPLPYRSSCLHRDFIKTQVEGIQPICYAMPAILNYLQLVEDILSKICMWLITSILFSSTAVKQLFICASLLCNSNAVHVRMSRAAVCPLRGCCASVKRKTRANIEAAE